MNRAGKLGIVACGSAAILGAIFYAIIKSRRKNALKKLLYFCNDCKEKSIITKSEYEKRNSSLIPNSIHYEIMLTMENSVSGQAKITFKLKNANDDIYLDYEGGWFTQLKINGSFLDPTTLYSKPKIKLPKKYLKKGNNKISVKFGGEYLEDGIWKFPNNTIYMNTAPHNLPRAIPCLNQPNAVCSVKLYYENNAKEYYNIPITNVGLIKGNFQEFKPLGATKVPIKLLCSENGAQILRKSHMQLEIFDNVIKGIEYFENLFKVKYKGEKLDIVILPDIRQKSCSYYEYIVLSEDLFEGPLYKYNISIAILRELSSMFIPQISWWDELIIKEIVMGVAGAMVYCSLNSQENINDLLFNKETYLINYNLIHPNSSSDIPAVETLNEAIESFDINIFQTGIALFREFIKTNMEFKFIDLVLSGYENVRKELKSKTIKTITYDGSKFTTNTTEKMQFQVYVPTSKSSTLISIDNKSKEFIAEGGAILIDSNNNYFCAISISSDILVEIIKHYESLDQTKKRALLKCIPLLIKSASEYRAELITLLSVLIDKETNINLIIEINSCIKPILKFPGDFTTAICNLLNVLKRKMALEDEDIETYFAMIIYYTNSQESFIDLFKLMDAKIIKSKESVCLALAKIQASSHIRDEDKENLFTKYDDPTYQFILKCCSDKKPHRDEVWSQFERFHTNNTAIEDIIDGMRAFWEQKLFVEVYSEKFLNCIIKIFEDNGQDYGYIFFKYLRPPFNIKVL